MMTPNDIDVLIHYHVSNKPHARISAVSVQQAIKQFVKCKVLSKDGTMKDCYYTTAKGVALVKMLCATPLPQMKWFDPRFKDDK